MKGKTAPPQKGSGTDVFHQAFLSRSFKYNDRNNNKNEDSTTSLLSPPPQWVTVMAQKSCFSEGREVSNFVKAKYLL